MDTEDKILYREFSYKLNGILFEAQNSLGTKFQEKHYLKMICGLLDKSHIPYDVEVPLQIEVDGVIVGKFRADLIVDNKILVELKAVDRLSKDHKLQIIRYLQALDLRLGLLVNFRVRPLQIWRVTN